jgi:hypothetical protein
MLRLRQKLEGDPSHPLHFLTVYGRVISSCLEALCRMSDNLEISVSCDGDIATHRRNLRRLEGCDSVEAAEW